MTTAQLILLMISTVTDASKSQTRHFRKYEIYTEEAPFHSTLTKPRTNERLIGSPLEAYCHFQFEDSGELILSESLTIGAGGNGIDCPGLMSPCIT